MIEENPSQKGKESGEQPGGSDIHSVEPSPGQNVTGKHASDPRQNQPKQPRKFLVEILKDDELKPFEQQTLELAKQTVRLSRTQTRLTIWAVIIALVGAAFVLMQLKQMTWNNQILASQFEKSVVDAIESNRNTREQLGIAHQQAKAAQEQVSAIQKQMRQDQRPWVRITAPQIIPVVESQPVIAKINITNVGKTAASKVDIKIVVEQVKVGSSPTFDYRPDVVSNYKTGTVFPFAPQPDFFAPMFLRNKTRKREFLSHDAYQEWTNRQMYIAAYGEITYFDVFGIFHSTKFCYWVTHTPSDEDEKPIRYKKCADYNSVDHN